MSSQRSNDITMIGGRRFADPFFAPSSDFIPDSLEDALDLAQFLYFLNPVYQQASRRVVSHFITDFDFSGDTGDEDEKGELRDYLHSGLELTQGLLEMGDEWACYGNAFFRLHFPFDRYLVDRRGGRVKYYALSMFRDAAEFDLQTLTYTVPDPTDLTKKVKLPIMDRRSTDIQRIKLRKINPRRMHIMHSWVSGKNSYVWRFDDWFKADIKAGKLFQINETPLPMLKAIQKGQDFLFSDDQIFHFRSPTISGISNNGWGLPPTIANYRSLHQLQVYRRIDEAIGLDYLLPFRLFSPSVGPNSGNNLVDMLMSQWTANISQLIKNRRVDPNAMHALPFPVTYQEVGGQGKEYVPKDLIEYQTNDMLDGFGYPAELFRGNLEVTQVPTSVRLFENSFQFIYSGFNRFTRWVTRRVRDYMQQEQIKVTLQPPRIADNLEKQYVYMQLLAAGEISRRTGLRDLGITQPVEEKKRRAEEDIQIQKDQMRLEQEFNKEVLSGAGGASAPTDDSGGEAGGSSVTPLDVMDKAREQAAQLLQMQVGDRRKALDQLRATNPTLHAAVKEMMEQARGQAASQGRAGVAQMVGGGQGQPQAAA